LLALAGDERLVEQIRRGNELAFEVAFERHGAGILAFCRHMLGSREEAEDAVQHAFAAAYRNLQGEGERQIALKPWLYTIARNRCLSVLRARREQTAELEDVPTEGLSDEVERRSELRELLADVRELPEDQRAALLLAEAAGMSHIEVAQVLGCEAAGVKGLVFRARSSLIERRSARETSCDEIREQLATLRGGALRRNELRHHLRGCPGCSAYREEVRRQRQMLAVALPIVPSLGLKSNVLAAAGIGGGGAGGAAAAGSFAGGTALGSLASGTVAKVAVVGVLATGGAAAGTAVVERSVEDSAPAGAVAPERAASGEGERPGSGSEGDSGQGARISAERSHGQRGIERRSARSRGRGPKNLAARRTRARGNGRANGKAEGGRKLGQENRAEKIRTEPRANSAPRVKEAPAPREVAPKLKTQPERKVEPTAPAVESIPDAEPAPEPLPTPQSVEKLKPAK
jgi:RNA polymerase sigma factor (sigma-70 family)